MKTDPILEIKWGFLLLLIIRFCSYSFLPLAKCSQGLSAYSLVLKFVSETINY